MNSAKNRWTNADNLRRLVLLFTVLSANGFTFVTVTGAKHLLFIVKGQFQLPVRVGLGAGHAEADDCDGGACGNIAFEWATAFRVVAAGVWNSVPTCTNGNAHTFK
jgi:hypothetical protein